MAKNFAPRVSKRQRKTIDLTEGLSRDLFQRNDDRLLKGAKLSEIRLKDIKVKDQVRTKFNDDSIRELAANIEQNGLIQPLVLHEEQGKYTLICGERRFRAMSTIEMESAPCFVLDDKTEEELMAIQFSENSSREALHYIDKADGIYNYKRVTKASERKIVAAMGISKTEVHRSILIGKMSKKLKEAAKKFNIEKYVLLEFDALENGPVKKKIEKQILSGEITKRAQLKKVIKAGGVIQVGKKRKPKAPALPKGLTANAFLKAMKQRTQDLDPETKALLKSIVEETRDMVDL